MKILDSTIILRSKLRCTLFYPKLPSGLPDVLRILISTCELNLHQPLKVLFNSHPPVSDENVLIGPNHELVVGKLPQQKLSLWSGPFENPEDDLPLVVKDSTFKPT